MSYPDSTAVGSPATRNAWFRNRYRLELENRPRCVVRFSVRSTVENERLGGINSAVLRSDRFSLVASGNRVGCWPELCRLVVAVVVMRRIRFFCGREGSVRNVHVDFMK